LEFEDWAAFTFSWLQAGEQPGHIGSILLGCVQTFFKSEIKVIEEPRDRRFADRNLLLCQPNTQFRQGDVRLLSNRRNLNPRPAERSQGASRRTATGSEPAAILRDGAGTSSQ
jgi:hypothetical protein